MDPGVLAQVLRPLQNLFSTEAHPELLVGRRPGMIPRPVSVWMRLDGSPQGLPLSRGDGGLPDGPGRARMEPLDP